MAKNAQRLIPTLGGVAVVCCVHDREKRQVVTERMVAELGRQVGQIYDSRKHRLITCACCENLFVTEGDEPSYCYDCRGPIVHPLGGPLNKAALPH